MAGEPAVGHRRLAGRAGAVGDVVELLRRALRNQFGALLVTGDAGIGKTALVAEACTRVADRADVVWGTCLPLGSREVRFLPLRAAVRAWAASRDLEASPSAATAGLLEFDSWLESVCRERPAVLVMDDLQWADQSSLDALMYVLAGPPNRRLAVVGALRNEELPDGHPVRRWLADVRRLPGVRELALQPLDRPATAEQLMGLLGQPPHESLVDEVFARTRGNPYLTVLLARGLPPNTQSLPADLPSSLRDAVTRAWHGLPGPARELIRLVAVGGGPQRADGLAKVVAAAGLDGDIVALLREAVHGDVLTVGRDGTYWFVHPLLAEMLEASLLPEERRTLHAAFATVLESQQSPDAEWAARLADHHFAAGHVQEAYRWALIGAERADGGTETLRLLRRALGMLPGTTTPAERIILLRRVREAADRAGSHVEELAAVNELLALVDRDQDPLAAAELLVRRMHLRFSTGQEFMSPQDAAEALRLAAPYPASAEYALATSELAHAEMWHAVPSGEARAIEAVGLARASGSDRALSYALTGWVTVRAVAGDHSAAADARHAQLAAIRVKDYWAYVHATLWAANSLDCTSSPAQVECLGRGREELLALGAPHSYVAWLSSIEASGLLSMGRWRACAERLRDVLGAAPGPFSDLSARLSAGQLAVRQGRLAEARGHFARAEEIAADFIAFRNFGFDAPLAELAIAEGDVGRAMTVALASIQGDGVVPTMAERLVPLAAQAAADEAQRLRDRRADPQPALDRLEDLRRRYPVIVPDDISGPVYDLQLVAMQAWYDAEVERARGGPAAAAAWQRAAQACRAGLLAWDEAYAWWRAAEALLQGRADRDTGADALRQAHALATDLAAAPLRASIEALGRGARIPLAVPAMPTGPAAALPGLTPREREVLALLVAGRTYGQIARQLVVSEKTVSVHISNLLRKTGTTSRVDLAQLVSRLTEKESAP
jgi:DNA-binding CsgD family transcriptional regulator